MFPYYFTDRILQNGFVKTLDSHQINHASSTVKSKPNYSETETRFVSKLFRRLAFTYLRLINQYIFEFQTVFSFTFVKEDEDGQMLGETDLYFFLMVIKKYHRMILISF